MKVIVLTDHKTHSKTDSIYRFCEGLSSENLELHIASRSLNQNFAFFSNEDSLDLYTKLIDEGFIFDGKDSWFLNSVRSNIHDFDGVILRLDSPISNSWLTWINSILSVVCINDALGVQFTRKREFLLELGSNAIDSKFITSLTALKQEIDSQNVVVKLDDSYGGKGVLKFTGDERKLDFENLSVDITNAIESNILDYGGVLVQKYSCNIHEGDKRFLVAFGQLLGAFKRIPSEGGWLCNVAQGASIVSDDVNQDEYNMIMEINKKLTTKGIYIYGVDTLVDDNGDRKVSELNVTNPGGFVQLEDFIQKPIFKNLASLCSLYLREKNQKK